jgi:hypothetical protein
MLRREQSTADCTWRGKGCAGDRARQRMERGGGIGVRWGMGEPRSGDGTSRADAGRSRDGMRARDEGMGAGAVSGRHRRWHGMGYVG